MKLVENGNPVEIAPAQSAYGIRLPPVAGGRTSYQMVAILAWNQDPIIPWVIGLQTGATLVGGQVVRVGNYVYFQCSDGTMVLLGSGSGPVGPVWVANNPINGAFVSAWFDYVFQKLVPSEYTLLTGNTFATHNIQSTLDAG